jgi:translation initiation factor 4A|tara:strand:- start:10 stop:1185 length:1176 start_codon:yes stop_codon:yes gene_type:complete
MEELEANEEIKTINKWDDYDLKVDLLRGIYSYGFENPSLIQKTAILPIIEKRDVIAQAPSGTGKTGAFTISCLERIDVENNTTQALILAPTHELVKQISSVVTSIGDMMKGLKVKTLVGGTSVSEDTNELKTNVPHIIVGSVGRVNDMIRRKNINTKDIQLFILDEADEMLSGGFLENIYQIFTTFNHDLQVAIFSATLPDEIIELTNKFMRNPLKITMEAEKLNLEGIQQHYIALENDQQKYETLKDLFGFLNINQTIVYVNSVNRVIDLYEAMIKDGNSVCCIHSSMKSHERQHALNDFKKGIYRTLISSNVTSRGIDVQQVSIVINFDIPRCVHNYLHRIGRSGRWGRKGMAINFITREDIGTMKRIESHYKSNITELPSDFEKTFSG